MTDQYSITIKISSTFASAGTPINGGGIPHAFVERRAVKQRAISNFNRVGKIATTEVKKDIKA